MKTYLMSSLLALTAASLTAQTSILVDFGKEDLQSSAASDPNGYHWNNYAVVIGAPGNFFGWETISEEDKVNRPWTDSLTYYNDYVTLPYVLLQDMVDQNGVATDVSLALVEFYDRFTYDPPSSAGGLGLSGEEYADGLGPIPTDTGYPGLATMDFIYIVFDKVAGFTLSGLDDNKTYTLKFWGGQNQARIEPAQWTVGDLDPQVIETLNNTGSSPEDYAIFENVSPQGGEIRFKFEQGVPPDNFLPAARWNTMEIIGDFSSGGETWYGYPVVTDNWADTGSWLGWVNVSVDPWVWVDALSTYTYIGDDSGWVYVVN
ncbi:MAG: hypothetical protein AB3N33_02445 [Puniceicoccaceae bacterium]